MRVSVSPCSVAVVARPHRAHSRKKVGASRALACAALAAGAVSHAHASVSTFDAGPDGWGASFGSAAWVGAGGNSGGYLRLEAPGLGPSGRASAAAIFLGDQTHMLGTMLVFDAIVLEGPLSLDPTPGTPWSVVVTIVNSSMKQGVASRVFTDGVRLEAPWTTLSAALTGAEWGVTDKKFAHILAGVTDITIEVLANEIPAPFAYGVDNFGLIPTPGAAALLVIAGLISAVRRSR